MKVVWTEEQISRRISALAREIRTDAGENEILLVGVLKTAAVFLSDVLRETPGAVRYEFLDKIEDLSDTMIADAMEIDFLSHFTMSGRHVYLLKDVVSTGVIEQWLLSQLRMKNPATLKLVALIDRPDLRTTPLEVDFRAFVGENGLFVGYGLEQRGHLGNSRAISSV